MGEERRPLLISARGLMGLRTMCVEKEDRHREKTRKKNKSKTLYCNDVFCKLWTKFAVQVGRFCDYTLRQPL